MARLVPNWMTTLMSEEFDFFSLWDEKETDVFLFYRTYVHPNLGDTVYKDLKDRKINTYTYKETHETVPIQSWNAEGVLDENVEAIKQSKIIIIVFNKAFAESSTCLDLLAYIVNNFPNHYFKIIPVFGGVNRSDLENQTGDFAEAFATHEQVYREKVNKWREALKEVSILPSWKLERNFLNAIPVINEIRDAVSKKVGRIALNRSCLRGLRNAYAAASAGVTYILPPYDISVRDRNRDLAPCRVPLLNEDGIDIDRLNSQLKGLLSQMEFKNDQVLFVPILGNAGIGKTKLAQKLYDMIADHFDASCFIPSVKENTRKHGLERLQDKLLSELTGVTHTKINNDVQGINTLYLHLRQRKVLLSLDDVDNQAVEASNQGKDARNQLKALANPSFLGPGSIVIITTENANVLTEHAREIKNDPQKVKQVREYIVPPSNDDNDRHVINNPTRQLGGVITVLGYLETLGTKFCNLFPNWKLCGTLSSIVWIICCALNPSVNRLLREWNDAWKILLYVIFCLYVLVSVFLISKDTLKTFYARNQFWSFSALILRTIYTYWYDEAVHGKPGPLDVVSNIALGCISLSLSKRIGKTEFALFSACLFKLAVQVCTMDTDGYIIFAIISGFILFCMNLSSTQVPRFRDAGTRPHQD